MNTGPVALVTGAGTGIGRAAALALMADGFSLVLAGRRAEPLQAVAQGAAGRGWRALAAPADVTDADAVERLFAMIAAQFGRLDLLFNNAGVSARKAPIEAVDIDDWRRVIDTNLTGAFLCTRAAFRLMSAQEPRGGRIINNGSISAQTPRPDAAAYAAAKHAITGLTKASALEGRRHDIACGQIDIGNAATSMVEATAAGALQPDGSLLAEPTMDVEQAARAVAYMASLPLDANVLSLTVMATKMPLVGRG